MIAAASRSGTIFRRGSRRIRANNGMAGECSFYADNCRALIRSSDENDFGDGPFGERPISPSDKRRTNECWRTWTISRGDLASALDDRPRHDRKRPNIISEMTIRASWANEQVAEDITCPRVRTRGNVTIIFSLEIEATYDALVPPRVWSTSSTTTSLETASVSQMEKEER